MGHRREICSVIQFFFLLIISVLSRRTYHDHTVFPSKNASPILLTGEGPGIAAPKAMEWGTEMTGIHRQYQSWGYLDPFPVLRDGARRYTHIHTRELRGGVY